MRSSVERMSLKTTLYAISVGCIASQNTYLEGSVHTVEARLHKIDVSTYPVPQQPTLTCSYPTTKITADQ